MEDIVEVSVGRLIDDYVTEYLVRDLILFGVRRLASGEVWSAGFERVGNKEFSLLEKCFRIKNKKYLINFKMYFCGGEYYSNGIDIYNRRILSALREYISVRKNTDSIKKIIMLYEPDGDYGSLIVNDVLDVRFGKQGRYSKKKQYHITGISTDFEYKDDWRSRSTSTRGAKIMKPQISLESAKIKYKGNGPLQKLIVKLIEFFPEACGV